MATCNEIGKRIKLLRMNRGITQAELAKNLNVKRETVNQWENGTRDLKTDYSIKLADFFGVSCDEILRGVNSENVSIYKQTGLDDESVKILNQRKDNKLFKYALNYIIHDYEVLKSLFNYICTSAVYEKIRQSDYMLIPQKNITEYHRDVYFAQVIEKIPLLRKSFIEDLCKDESTINMLCLEYLKQFADLKKCKYFTDLIDDDVFFISGTSDIEDITEEECAEIVAQEQELLKDIDYMREREEYNRICEEEARREAKEYKERVMKKYDIIRKFLKYIKNEKEGESHGNNPEERK